MINIPQTDYGSNTQIDLILYHFAKYGSITAKDAELRYGIRRLGARIYDLRKLGYTIISKTETGKNRYGHPCSWSRYYLKGEPNA